MKYIIKMDINRETNVILDNTYIKDCINIPNNFSWYNDRPKYIASLQISRQVIKLLKSSQYSYQITRIYPEPLYEI